MIKKFIERLLGKAPRRETPPEAAPPAAVEPEIPLGVRTEVGAQAHGIDPRLLDANAVRVVKTLKDAGFEAYIVGGAVRDLLVGLRPKDFDVATDATPEQVKSLFRRAFIIGRRFRLVHVVFGRGREHETIEVSTFRAYLDAAAATAEPAAAVVPPGEEREPPAGGRRGPADGADRKHVVDASGRVLRDNVWGPQVEDAARRDFTVNAMYYDPVTQVVVDYHGGLADVRAKLLRMIGDPETRYREDPVRIVRVVRFAAKLGFALEPATLAPIARTAPLLSNVPASRLFDEMVKLVQTGHALASVEQLRRFGLVGGKLGVFPVLDAALAPARPNPVREQFVRLALEDTDRRVAEGRAVAPSFMLACMLWHDVQERWSVLRAAGDSPFPALQQAVDAVFEARIGDISGRGKLAADMRETWLMQPRFERRTASSAATLIEQVRFRAGYDFLRLRADCGEVSPALADWWSAFHAAGADEREQMLHTIKPAAATRARKPARTLAEGGSTETGRGQAPIAAGSPRPDDVPVPADADPAFDDEGADALDAEEGAEAAEAEGTSDARAPRKRRRRRRRPAAGTPEGGAAGGDAGSSGSNSSGSTSGSSSGSSDPGSSSSGSASE